MRLISGFIKQRLTDWRSLRPLSRTFIGVQLLLVVSLIAIPYRDMFQLGPLSWALQLPRVLQGGIEALILLACCIAVAIPKRAAGIRGLSLLTIGLVYLRLHRVDVQLFSAFAYAEALIAVGALILWTWRGTLSFYHATLAGVLCGFAFEALLVAMLSLNGWAYPKVLFSVIVTLGAMSAVAGRRRPLLYVVFRGSLRQPTWVRVGFVCLYAVVLVMAAKLYMISDFDSRWYGLRTQHVLGQAGSIFAELNLAHFVFYYPKLYEILILPLSGFGDSAFIGAFNVYIYVIILFTAYVVSRGVGAGKGYAALATLTVACVPAVASSALLVKPDLLTTSILFIAFLYCVRTISYRRLDDLWVASAALALSLAGKLVSVPYGGVFAICLVVAIAWGLCWQGPYRYLRTSGGLRSRHGALVFALCLGALAVVSYRTYHLTGLLIIEPQFLVDWLSHLGFAPHFPFEVAYANDGWHFALSDLLTWGQALFTPSKLPHIVMIWVGNVYLLTAIVMLVGLRWMRRRRRTLIAFGFAAAVFAFGLAAMAFYGAVPGGDGNYYDLPIICLTCITTAGYGYLPAGMRRLSVPVLVVLISFHAFAWFGTSPVWKSGTDTLNFSPFHSIFVSRNARQADLKINGLFGMVQLMQDASDESHCTALADGTPVNLFLLPCAVESTVTLRAAGSGLVENTGAVSDYVSKAHFDFIVITKSGADTPLSRVFDAYALIPGVREHDSVLYKALDLRGAMQPLPLVAGSPDEPSGLRSIRLATDGSLGMAEVAKVDENLEPWRKSIQIPDKQMRQYMGTSSFGIRDGAGITFPIGQLPGCRSTLSFGLGLLPVDQVLERVTGGLRVSVIDLNTHAPIVSATFTVPKNGFDQERWQIDVCKQAIAPGLEFAALVADPDRPASVVLADPAISAAVPAYRKSGSVKRP